MQRHFLICSITQIGLSGDSSAQEASTNILYRFAIGFGRFLGSSGLTLALALPRGPLASPWSPDSPQHEFQKIAFQGPKRHASF